MRVHRAILFASALTVAAGLACRPPDGPGESSFVDVADEAGLVFSHRNGAEGAFNYPELLHAGCGLVDVDGDGWLDVYLIQGDNGQREGGNRLFLNRGDGTFDDVTEQSGAGDTAYGTGVAAADYDADGDVDLYVVNLGRNTLLRNDGAGVFTDVTETAGVGDRGYSAAASFVDYDGDDDLDLYVANYVNWSVAIERPCYAPNGIRDYCSPGVYDRPQHDSLFRNDGDGTFTDVSATSGIRSAAGTGLGVVAADFTGDGRIDFFVANDQMPNFLWVGSAAGTFSEEALLRGCALNASGRPEAGMGIALGDLDSDGDWDLFVTHLDGETNTLYRNDGGFFQDVTDRFRLGGVSRARTGFGTGLFDYDCDGDLDLFLANGSVRLGDSMEPGRYAEPNQLLERAADGTFRDASHQLGPALEEVSRGTAFGDFDNDGTIDILISNNNGPPRLLQNSGCAGRHWLTVAGPAIGSVVTVRGDWGETRKLAQPGSSFGSSNDPRLHFGLGESDRPVTVVVRWPDGRTRTLTDVAPDQFLTVVDEGVSP